MKLEMRFATKGDCKILWEWRNDEETRKMAFSSDFIPYEAHKNWFTKSLRDLSRKILIIQDSGEKTGMVRFDIEKNEATININIAPDKRGKGYGTSSLVESCKYAFENFCITKIIALIKPENIASVRAFEKAGFSFVDRNEIRMVLYSPGGKGIFSRIVDTARKEKMRIAFPEADEESVLKAVEKIVREKIAFPVLIGNEQKIFKKFEHLGIDINPSSYDIIDPEKEQRFANRLFEIRKEKGLTLEEAKKLVKNPVYFSAMVLESGEVDGVISGAVVGTAESIRPFLQTIKTEEGIKKVSSSFIMYTDSKTYIFADCSIIVDPNPEELAGIAVATSETAKWLGISPRVAMLSFSTKGSAIHPFVDKVAVATELLKKQNPEITVEGEIQVDAAIVPDVARKKATSIIQGDANVLIFPDLNSGNIAYKLVERLGGYTAIGPIIQGLSKPINVLSRGCSVDDIFLMTALTVVQAQHKKNRKVTP
ncbi:MAG TPA: phosphate acetyltransferase [Candidatus Nanoarchaeia archaeon]|nr:phosphate acetyltransferase [Candidatus Nanoarchaeia archaeon]